MIKLVFIIFNLMGVMIYNFTYDKVSVDQSTPDKIGPGESFVVQLKINKGEYDGYAKWQQKLPIGFKAEMMETKGGTFSYKDNTVKLIWLELPEEENFIITYRIVTEEWVPKKSYQLEGRYSYIYENERKDVVDEKRITVGYPSDKAKHFSSSTGLDKSYSIKDKGLDKKTSMRDRSSNSQDIRYRVQIAAGQHEVEGNYFERNLHIDEIVYTEFHNGWKKYTVGEFSDYKSAREKRNSIWAMHQESKGAFITAYLSGKRISMDKALNISQEQWIK